MQLLTVLLVFELNRRVEISCRLSFRICCYILREFIGILCLVFLFFILLLLLLSCVVLFSSSAAVFVFIRLLFRNTQERSSWFLVLGIFFLCHQRFVIWCAVDDLASALDQSHVGSTLCAILVVALIVLRSEIINDTLLGVLYWNHGCPSFTSRWVAYLLQSSGDYWTTAILQRHL